jgi:hypothetical protein
MLFAPDVDVQDFQGNEYDGTLKSLTQEEVRFAEEDLKPLKTSDVLSVQFANPKRVRGITASKIFLLNGNMFLAQSMKSEGDAATVTSPCIGEQQISMKSIKSILYGRIDDYVAKTWDDLSTREIRGDMLILRKGNTLDFLTGVIGDITPETIQFLTSGQQIPVKKEKVFGIIFYRKDAISSKVSPVRLEFSTGETASVDAISVEGQNMSITWPDGKVQKMNADVLKSIDYSRGKLVYVSDLKPVNVEYVARPVPGGSSVFNTMFHMRKDQHIYGESLRLGSKAFKKGLCLHPDTIVTYRLAQQYQRLNCQAGIDAFIGNVHGQAQLVIKGDDKILLDTEVKGNGPMIPVDLDVSQVRELVIEVKCGPDGHDMGDNVILGGLRLIKKDS